MATGEPAFRIGSIAIAAPTVLAPMAAISIPPFRSVCLRHGCGLATTEMVAAQQLLHRPRRGRPRPPAFERADGERVLHVQLFGNDSASLGEAARVAEAMGADALDLNLGCPVRKVVHSGSGAALARNPEAAARCLAAMVAAVGIPVTAKIRSGWDDEHRNAADLARRLVDAGAAAIAVHARTREQQFGGRADWSVIRDVARAILVPVIGNGDVKTASDAERMRRETGCAAVMVGRGALGRPWVFEALASGTDGDPSPHVRVATMKEYVRRYAAWAGPARASIEMRRHLLWFVRGVPGAAAFRAGVNTASTPDEIDALLDMAERLLSVGGR